MNPPRGISAPNHATGVYVTPELLPHAFDADGHFLRDRYNTTNAVVHAWRPAHW
eukprot:COSAG05_NODE_1380_length_5022_cov_25.282348_2_plen_54_part_00